MGPLGSLLTFPLTGPLRGLLWVAEQLHDQARRELYDPERIRRQLTELELQLDLGQISEEEYEAAETALLEQLRHLREQT
ncbi:MAG: gas vesicle protein GvpG [Oscillochloridaceae bacterium]|nr:gas vesicle protein GvpG [Chloroflexaceae bacterium]MDW8388691.1 gas vesicle protein GvpG [Oscillochloridaceae bacterium]